MNCIFVLPPSEEKMEIAESMKKSGIIHWLNTTTKTVKPCEVTEFLTCQPSWSKKRAQWKKKIVIMASTLNQST